MTRPGRLLLPALFAACAGDMRSPDPRDPADPSSHPGSQGQTMHGVTLTAGAPRQDVSISALASPPSTLTLAITAIDNPSAQAFSVAASVAWSGSGGGTTEETIGSVTPYPASRPGDFVLGVPDAARAWLLRGDGQLVLRVALQPIDAARPLAEPLRVALGNPAWR